MTTNYHDAIAAGAAANAATINSPLGELDTALTATNATVATLSGALVATQANGAANASQAVITVDSTTGFLPGAKIEYALVGGVIETNTIATVDSPTQITCTGNIGSGGIPNNGYIGVVNLSTLLPSGAVTGAVSQAQKFTLGATLGSRAASGDDSALIAARAVGGTINSHGLRDESVLTAGSAAVGYAAFDAEYTAGGTSTYDHIAGIQSRMIYEGSGVLSEWRGYYTKPIIKGPVTTVKHIDIRNAVKSGDGTLTNQYALFVEELDEASTENYAIYTAPSTPSLFGGKVNVQATVAENGTGPFDGHIRLAALATSDHLALGWNNTGGYGWMQALKTSAAAYAPIILNANGGNVGIGLVAPAGKLHVDQSSATGAIPALALDQADESEGFIDFLGTAAASAAGPISTWTTGGALTGFVRVEINGAAYWMPYYTAPSS